eukprot:scaffold86167_cov21-Phaeocystis_antarctica.AAC.1
MEEDEEGEEGEDGGEEDEEGGEGGGGREGGGGAAAGSSDGAASQRRQWSEPADSCSCGQCIRGGGNADSLKELPPTACGSVDGMRHRVHACCYAECLPAEEWTAEEKAANYPSCPRCRLLRRRLHLGVGSRAEEVGGEAAGGEAA